MTSQLPGSLKMIRGIQASSIMPIAKIVLQALLNRLELPGWKIV